MRSVDKIEVNEDERIGWSSEWIERSDMSQ